MTARVSITVETEISTQAKEHSQMFKITTRDTGAVIWQGNVSSLTDAVCLAIQENVSLAGANLRGVNLAGQDLTGANLLGADLTEANLSNTKLKRAVMSGATLYGANMTEADVSETYLDYANMSTATLTNADLSGTRLRGTDMSKVDISGANLLGADIWNVELKTATWFGCSAEEVISMLKLSPRVTVSAKQVDIGTEHVVLNCEFPLPDQFKTLVFEKLKSYIPVPFNGSLMAIMLRNAHRWVCAQQGVSMREAMMA